MLRRVSFRRLVPGLLLLLLAGGALVRGLGAPRPGTPRGTRVAVAQLAHLGRGLEGRADAMQALFPEGRVFTLALYGQAWVNVGLDTDDAALQSRALREARRARRLAEAGASRAAFGPAGGLPYGLFYHAWVGRLQAGTLHLGGGAREDARFRQTCRALDAALRAHGPFVDSYPGQAWPADAAVAASVLASCGHLLGGGYTRTAQAWLRAARARADSATGLLPHAAFRPDPRGSSAALMVPFVYEIDPAFATAQYEGLTAHFPTRFVGLPALREYPRGTEGVGDVDSGPLVAGVSAPASVVGIAAARITGRPRAAADLRATSEVLGLPVAWRGRRTYGFAQLPVGEAFLAWASTGRPWVAPAASVRTPSPFEGWRVVWALLCTPVLVLGLVLTWRGLRRPQVAARYGAEGRRSR